MRVEEQGLILEGSWDLAAPFGLCDVSLEEKRGSSSWLGQKNFFSVVFLLCQEETSFTWVITINVNSFAPLCWLNMWTAIYICQIYRISHDMR